MEGVGLAGSPEFRFSRRFWGWAAAVARICWSHQLHLLEFAGSPKEAASTLAAASPKKQKAR